MIEKTCLLQKTCLIHKRRMLAMIVTISSSEEQELSDLGPGAQPGGLDSVFYLPCTV
jgi:hypothetical protein